MRRALSVRHALGPILTVLAAATAARADVAHLHLVSAPGSYIGGGQTYDFTDTNAGVFFPPNTNLANGDLATVEFNVFENGNVYAGLEFSTEDLGIALQVGNYADAERAAFATAGHPGLDVTFYDEGSDVLTGSFDITNVSYYKDPVGNYHITSFAATFDQTSDNATSHVTGSFTFSAVPEPSTFVLLGAGGAGLLIASRRRRIA